MIRRKVRSGVFADWLAPEHLGESPRSRHRSYMRSAVTSRDPRAPRNMISEPSDGEHFEARRTGLRRSLSRTSRSRRPVTCGAVWGNRVGRRRAAVFRMNRARAERRAR